MAVFPLTPDSQSDSDIEMTFPNVFSSTSTTSHNLPLHSDNLHEYQEDMADPGYNLLEMGVIVATLLTCISVCSAYYYNNARYYVRRIEYYITSKHY